MCVSNTGITLFRLLCLYILKKQFQFQVYYFQVGLVKREVISLQ